MIVTVSANIRRLYGKDNCDAEIPANVAEFHSNISWVAAVSAVQPTFMYERF